MCWFYPKEATPDIFDHYLSVEMTKNTNLELVTK